MHYGCAAVNKVVIGQRGPKAREWEIVLTSARRTEKLLPKLEEFREKVNRERERLRRQVVDTIWVIKP